MQFHSSFFSCVLFWKVSHWILRLWQKHVQRRKVIIQLKMNNIFLFKIIKVDHLWLLCMLQGVAFLHYVCLSFFWFTWLYASPATTKPVVPKQENNISIWKNIKMCNKNSRWKSRMKNIFKTKSSEFSTIFILI